jgi:nucleotide-binding universal stress UspA family protein
VGGYFAGSILIKLIFEPSNCTKMLAKGTTSLKEIVLCGTAAQLIKEAPCLVLIVSPVESS